MKLVAAATVLVLSAYSVDASRSARRKQRLTNLYESTNSCFSNSICAKSCADVQSLEDFLEFSGRRCKMCAAGKLKGCNNGNAQNNNNSNSNSSPPDYANEPDSREKCVVEKCSCIPPIHKLSRSEKKACKVCARKNGCFRMKPRHQALAELKKSQKQEQQQQQEQEEQTQQQSSVYTPDEGISSMASSEVSAILGFAQPGNPLRILPQQEVKAEVERNPNLRIPGGNSPNYPVSNPNNNNDAPSSISSHGQTIGRFTFSDKFKRNGWNPFQPEDAPKAVADIQPDSEDYLDDIYTDGHDETAELLKSGEDEDYEFVADEEFINDDGESDYYQIYDDGEEEDNDDDFDYSEEDLDEDIYSDGSENLKNSQGVDNSGSFNPFSNEQVAETEAWENPANNLLHHESLVGDLPESMQSAVANMKQGDSYPTGLNYSKENSEENKFDHKDTRRSQRKQLRQTTRKAKRLNCIQSVQSNCSMCSFDEGITSWKELKGINRSQQNKRACMACIKETKSNC